MKWTDIVTRKQNILLIYTKLYGWCEKMNEVLGVGFNHMLMVSHKESTIYYVYKTELSELSKILKDKILNDKVGPKSLARVGIQRFQDVIDYLKVVTSKNLTESTNNELASYFKNYFEKQIKSLPFLVLPTFVDDIFVEQIQAYLDENLKIPSDEKVKKIIDYINVFSTLEEESYATKAENELLDIALLLSKKDVDLDTEKFIEIIKENQVIYEKFTRHTERWEWLPIQAEERPYDISFFIKEAQQLAKNPTKTKARLLELDNHIKILKSRKKELLKTLNIDQPRQRLIDVFQEWVYLKDFRRSIISQERLYSRSLYAEIGKRLNLTGREVRFLSPDELINILNKKADFPPKEEIYSRMESFVLIRHNEDIQLLTGKKAEEVIQQELTTFISNNEKVLKGTSASPGKVTGKVKIVLGVQDEHKIESGDVLVARQTTPDLLGAMKKSVAIITDEGGLLCHAAIVSRELKLPCIVGIKNATKILKNGDIIEVDANNGIVKILEK